MPTYPALLAELMRRGWSDVDIAKVAGENVLRVMAEAERVKATLGQTAAKQAAPETSFRSRISLSPGANSV